MIQLAGYRVIRRGENLQDAADRSDTPPRSTMFDYLFGANGVFIKASRMFLSACVPVGWCDIRGLAVIEPSVALDAPRVPAALIARALNRSREVCVRAGKPREILFYLIYEDTSETTGEWRLVEPEQIATGGSVHPTDDAGDEYRRAIIELHSHNEMQAFFSSQDDRDEQGFRIYAVIGNIFTKPALRVRVGVYGYFYELAAADIFELPEGLEDAAEIGERR
jgi:PRTRC genetic system protein A